VTSRWPPLDTHAHVDVSLGSRELLALRAVVFAVTRSLGEAQRALSRLPQDELAVWGVGTHPASPDALAEFEPFAFARMAERAAVIGEVGLDGTVKSRLGLQTEVFSAVLGHLQSAPRLTTIHSHHATKEVVELLQDRPIRGAILHWWLGDARATATALELGAYFSANYANAGHLAALEIPLERLLLETDHPDGDRRSPAPRQPGRVEAAEKRLAGSYGVTPDQLRLATWHNLHQLARRTDSLPLFPARLRTLLEALPPS
jgi:TatD DNase family protein